MTTCVPIGRWPFATVDVCTGGGKVWTEATILGVDQARPLGAPFYLYTPNNLPVCPYVLVPVRACWTAVQVSCI